MRQALQVALVALGNLATTSLAFVASGPAVRPKWALPLAHAQKSSRRRLPPLMVGEDYGMDALPPCVIKVIGVGGGGSNAVLRMVEYGVKGVDFVIMNTDVQALARAPPGVAVVKLGEQLTGGLGAGGVPDIGRQAAEESLPAISAVVANADMVFVTAGMGGGTGSGAAEIVAAAAKEAGALTVGVVTRPFNFEGGKRKKQAAEAVANLKPNVDALIVVANDKLLQILPESVPVNEALTCADDILRQGVVGISDIIVQPGLINVDFADVRSVLENAGTALMGIGSANGHQRATLAAERAVSSPLLDLAVKQAKGAVFNVVGGPDLSIGDVSAAADVINAAMAPDAMIIFGALVDPRLAPGSDVTVTMVATGFEQVDGTESLPNIYNTPNAAPKAAAAANAGAGGGGGRGIGGAKSPLTARSPPAPGAAAAEAREAYMRGKGGGAQQYDGQPSQDGYDEPPPEPPSFLSRLRRKK